MHFSSRNQPAGHFFLKSPITPQKSHGRLLKIQQTFGQLTDSHLSIISKLKAFETIGDKTLKGRGEEFVSTYSYP